MRPSRSVYPSCSSFHQPLHPGGVQAVHVLAQEMHIAVLELDGDDKQVLVGSFVDERAATHRFADHERATRGHRGHGHLGIAGLEQAAYRREKLIDDRLLAAMRAPAQDAPDLYLPYSVVVKGRTDLHEIAAAQRREELEIETLVLIAGCDHGRLAPPLDVASSSTNASRAMRTESMPAGTPQ